MSLNSINIVSLIEAARKVRKFGYSPYYKVKVGAALLGKNGKIYTACNVENATPAAHVGCAESNAIAAAVSDGCKNYTHVAVVAFDHQFAMPCGPCRQKLYEFSPDILIIAGLNRKNEYKIISLKDLLPYAFSKKDIPL